MDGLILAGGRGSRMGGRHKGNLKVGDTTFVQRLISEMKRETERIYLSYGECMREHYEGCIVLQDLYQGLGPIGGIYTGLRNCESDCLMVVACDMPFLKIELFRFLMGISAEKEAGLSGCDVWIPVCGGRNHPLAAIYRKNTANVLETQIHAGDYRMGSVLKKLKTAYIEVRDAELVRMLCNVNTLEDYGRLKIWTD